MFIARESGRSQDAMALVVPVATQDDDFPDLDVLEVVRV